MVYAGAIMNKRLKNAIDKLIFSNALRIRRSKYLGFLIQIGTLFAAMSHYFYGINFPEWFPKFSDYIIFMLIGQILVEIGAMNAKNNAKL